MKKYTFKKVIGLVIKVESQSSLSYVLNQLDDINDHIRRLTEMANEGINEDNAERFAEWYEWLQDLLEDRRYKQYIPKHYYGWFEDEINQANETLEEMAKEWQREIDGLNRWYYSTRL